MVTKTKDYTLKNIAKYLFVSISIGYFKCCMADMKDYCTREIFNPKCGRNEVIIMKHAVYGRMRLNKCVKQDLGFIGCKTDILRLLEQKCSNKNECKVDLYREVHENENIYNPCGELVGYLEADYTCKQVFQIDQSNCGSGQVPVDFQNSITISSQNLHGSNCDTAKILISARPGQTLNISIIDFSWDVSYNPSRSCVNYLEFEDLASNRKTPVCAGTEQRRHVLQTTSHEILASFQLQDPENQRFLLHFEAIGCADTVPPEGTWVQRHGDETTLGCHHGDHTWTVTCQNNQWKGAVGSCGTGYKPDPNTLKVAEQAGWQIAPGMVVFAGVSVLMFFSALTFTVAVCFYSKKACKKYEQLPIPHTQGHLIAHGLQTYPYSNTLPNDQFITKIREQHGNNTLTEYMNAGRSKTDSMHSDTVKYYVLENVTGK